MERIAAARAMEWSIELEKGLRSRKPGRPIEAIRQTASRLEQWSREPSPSMSVCNLFGLVPGEDRLFANTILLRLADAFRSGDKQTKLCVLKVFLHELKQRKLNNKQKSRKRYNGILSKDRVSNHSELLKRVKIVFDTGDVESRALALRLLGCWADFAKESAEIRYIILSSLNSRHDLEVKASLFATGSFCEVSEDFGYVVLDNLINIVASTQTSFDLRQLGIRVFAKLGCCSSIIARRAYKESRKLLLLFESYNLEKEDRFFTEMLRSLSRLASKSMNLIPEQVELLVSFIDREFSTLHVQDMALRCLQFFIRVGGVSCVHVNANLIKTFFRLLNKTELPPGLHCKALRILSKIFQCGLPELPCMDMVGFGKLIPIVENAARSSITSKTLLALRLLVEISCNLFKGRIEMVLDGDSSCTSLPTRVILLVMDQINTLLKNFVEKPFCSTDSDLKRECQSLLNLVLHLVQEHPEMGVMALDRIRCFVESLVDMHKQIMCNIQPCEVHKVVGFKGEKQTSISSELVFCACSFVQACLGKLDEAGAITTQVHDKVKILVKVVQQSGFFDHHIGAMYPLLLESHTIWHSLRNESKETDLSLNDYWVEQQIPFEFAKMLLGRRDNWYAYRAAKYSACEGAWFAATFTLGHLLKKVQSESSNYWFKSLALFAHAESEIQLLLFPKQGLNLVKGFNADEFWDPLHGDALVEFGQVDEWYANTNEFCEKLARACSSIRSSADILGTTVRTGQQFYFQRWFLVLRAKVLETVIDLNRLLGAYPCNREDFGSNGQVERVIDSQGVAQDIQSLMYFLAQISFRLKGLAQEFDLLTASFMNIDTKSSKIISIIALNCSFLAFCTGFTLFFPQLHNCEDSIYRGLESSDKSSQSMLIQNLLGRLWHLDIEITSNLKLLSTIVGESNSKSGFHLQSGSLVPSIGHNERDAINVCKFAVSAIIQLQNEAKGLNDEEVLSRVTRASLQLLSDILKKWMYISFRIPKYFFRVRPCIGVELFAFNSDTRSLDKISIFPGFHLSLNLCLQLKNAPPDLSLRLTKFYCILTCRTSYQLTESTGENKGQLDFDFQAMETEEMVDLNEKLLLYVKEGIKKTIRKHDRDADGGSVNTYVCFEPNDRGQGFSTCLLDVSTFPLGSYKIKWHSCCIDSQGSYCSLLPLNSGPVFAIEKSPVVL